MYYFVQNIDSRVISDEASSHFFSTRVSEGDRLTLCDHRGSISVVEITRVDKKTREIGFEIMSKETLMRKSAGKVLIQAIPDKQYLDKLVEVLPLGDIDDLILFHSEFSPKYNINYDRLEKILIRSTEQCQRLWRPEIKFVEKSELVDLLNQYKPMVLDCDGEFRERNGDTSSIIVGPEGGWSQGELSEFRETGLQIVKFNNLVLPAWIAGFSYFI